MSTVTFCNGGQCTKRENCATYKLKPAFGNTSSFERPGFIIKQIFAINQVGVCKYFNKLK